jgi:hypothetical protein
MLQAHHDRRTKRHQRRLAITRRSSSTCYPGEIGNLGTGARRMATQTALAAIPKPPGHPIIGNMLDLQGETPLLNLVELAKIYGPIFRLEIAGRSLIVLSRTSSSTRCAMIIASTSFSGRA